MCLMAAVTFSHQIFTLTMEIALLWWHKQLLITLYKLQNLNAKKMLKEVPKCFLFKVVT